MAHTVDPEWRQSVVLDELLDLFQIIARMALFSPRHIRCLSRYFSQRHCFIKPPEVYRQAYVYSCTICSPSCACHLLISTPSPGVCYCQQLTLSVCHTPSNCFFFFVSRWNRAIFWPSFLHVPLYKTLFFNF